MTNLTSADCFRNIRSRCYDAKKNRSVFSQDVKVQLDMAHEKIENLAEGVLLMLEYLEKIDKGQMP